MDKLRIVRDDGEEAEELHRDNWLPLVSDYIDGTLPEAEATRLEQHLAECPACTADLEGMRQAVSALRRLPEMPAPRSFELTPLQARRLRPARLYRVAQIAATMAASFLLFALTLDVFGNLSAPVNPPVVSQATTAAPTLPPLGTLPPSNCSNPNAGPNCAFQASPSAVKTVASDPTATAAPTTSTVAVSASVPAIRWVEIGLAICVVLLAVFAFAVRPRAPGRLKA